MIVCDRYFLFDLFVKGIVNKQIFKIKLKNNFYKLLFL
jgi:hypothetical protein